MAEQLEVLWQLLEVEAHLTNCRKRKVGAIIYNTSTKEIVGIRHNYHENGVCDCIPGPSTAKHAEIVAIDNIDATDINFNKDKCIALINRRPCDDCNKALNKVVYEIRYRQE